MDDELIDFDALKAPILDLQPTGEDPRTNTSPNSPYFSLKDVRNKARAAERNALVDNEPLLNYAYQWRSILEQVPELLISQCKDLEFTAWLIEALARYYGFQGLTTGFRTAAVLIEEFWQDLYPMPDEDGVETRIAPLVGLNGVEGEGTLLMPIACIPITEHNGEKAYSLWEYEQALEIDRLDEDKKKQRINAGGIELEKVLDAVNSSTSEFYQQLHHDIQEAALAYSTLVDFMDDACGFPLPTTQISKRLQACLDAVSYLADDKLQESNFEEVGISLIGSTSAESEVTPSFHSQLNSRKEAINNLKQIADFF